MFPDSQRSVVASEGTLFIAAPHDPDSTRAFAPPPTTPQFTHRGMDASFLNNIFLVLQAQGSPPDWTSLRPVRRIAGAQPRRPGSTTHLYECSDELCELLAGLGEARVAEIARNWHRLLENPLKPPRDEPEHRVAHRTHVLRRMVELAQQTRGTRNKLMLRVVYRGRRIPTPSGLI